MSPQERRTKEIHLMRQHIQLIAGLLLLSALPASAAIINVPADYPTISAAITAASPGDEIIVAAGPYPEQLSISKSLTLTGAGAGASTIQAPGVMVPDGNGFVNIITIMGTGVTVDLSGFTIAGPGPTGCGSINTGIFVGGDAHADIHDNEILDIRDEPFSGCQNGQGIWVGHHDTFVEVGTATITNNTITGYQKGGIVIDNTGSDATIAGNTITGVGPTATIAQNGVQISRGATANVSGNDISGHVYSPGGTWSGGVLVFWTSNVTVSGNSVDANNAGIFVYDWPASGDPVTGNVVELNDCDNNVNAGIYVRGTLTNGNTIQNNTADGNWAGVWGSWSVSGNTYTGNTITNSTGNGFYFWMADNNLLEDNTVEGSISGSGDAWGIAFDGDSSDGSDNNTVSRNSVINGDVGVWVGNNADGNVIEENFLTGNLYGVQVSTYSGEPDPTNTTIYSNDLSGNTTAAIENTTALVADASGNWWGDLDPTDDFTGSVDYNPWLAVGTDIELGTAGFQGDLSTLYVDDDSPGTGHIQEGVDLASGSTINVLAGTYEEQLNIDKAIELAGAGAGSTTVLSPVTLTDFFMTSAANYPIVYIHDIDGVFIHDLTVDGAGRGNSNYRFLGIGFLKAGGTIQDCDIVNVMDTPFSGAQHGNALYAWNDEGSAHTVNVSGCNAIDYQKGGLIFNGSLGTGNVSGCVVTGAGPTTVTAQNGIQFGWGSGGTIVSSSSTGHIYTGGGWASAGALLYLAGTVDISGACLFQDNNPGVYAQEVSGSMTGGTISNQDPESWDGMYVMTSGVLTAQDSHVKPASPMMEEGGGGNGDRVARSFSFDGVSFLGHGKTDSWGVYFSSSGDLLTVDMTDCTVSDWDYGIYVSEGGGVVNTTAHDNTIADNTTYGWYASGTTVQDGTNNWWGHASGPYHATSIPNPGGLGNPVSDFVSFEPWTGMGTIAPDPPSSGPINCSDLVTLDFHYTPDGMTPALRGYSIQVTATSEVSFTDADITVYTLPGGATTVVEILENGANDYLIDYAILGTTTGITTEEDLFSIVFHPVSDGTATVSIASATLRDLDNGPIGASFPDDATIEVDCTSPVGAPGGIAAAPGHEEVTVTWTDPTPADFTGLEIWRGMWHDGANNTAYPEYDDLVGSTIPTRPASRAAALASVEWDLAGTALPGDESFVDSHAAPRGVYYYELFSFDAALNYGPPAAANDRATNYWLGDVQLAYDGDVDAGDITVLGASYGEYDGDLDYNNECDVGPTDDTSRLGIPDTDDYVGFEDLMIFAMNYGLVAPLNQPQEGTDTAVFSWYQVDEETWALALLEPCNDLKGLRLEATLPAGVTVTEITAGSMLENQAGAVFLQNAGVLDVGLAVLGMDMGITGSGELFRARLSVAHEPADLELTARSRSNEPVEVEFLLTDAPDLPVAYRLVGNYPNPFNPKTTIRFDLVEEQAVKLVIFDVNGRRIVTLIDEKLPAGQHSELWNGRDEEGVQVASGVYFYRIEAGPLRETSRMLLLK